MRADNAPDWFRGAVQEKLPEYSKETEAIILLDELVTTVKDNGEIETRYRRVYKLLRPEALSKYGGMGVTFDGDTKLTYLKAWTITPDGIALEVKEADAVELSFTTFELYNGIRVKSLRFPEAKPGSIVGYELVRKQRPYIFDSVWTFPGVVPIHGHGSICSCQMVGNLRPRGRIMESRNLSIRVQTTTCGKCWTARRSKWNRRCRRWPLFRAVCTEVLSSGSGDASEDVRFVEGIGIVVRRTHGRQPHPDSCDQAESGGANNWKIRPAR